MSAIRIVTATRLSAAEFAERSLLGRSLRQFPSRLDIELAVDYSNRAGLPSVYNQQICREQREKTLVFIHDDVWINDFFLAERIQESLTNFDIVGVAGNTRGGTEQCGWAFREKPGDWDTEHLSGAVAHRNRGVSWYGPTPCAVKLLDGVLLAAKASTLLEAGVRFDPQFAFHFYDVDFCKSAVQAGLRLGTWPIAVTHASGGKFGSAVWQAAAEVYFRKWPPAS